MRVCTLCGESKPLEQFYERKKGSGRYRSQCKPCYMQRAIATRDPYKAREAKNRYMKTEKHRVKNLERSRRLYREDPEYYRMKQRARNIGSAVEILKEVLDRDKICQICGSDERLEYDHVYPRSAGGRGVKENLQILCKPCNLFKSNHFFLPGGGMMLNAR